jgi:hypothetical protein
MEPALRDKVPFVLMLIATLVILYQLTLPSFYYSGWPPRSTSPPAKIQIKTLGLKPGDIFKGRSITLLEMNTKTPIGWGPYFFPILYWDYRVALVYDMMNDARVMGVPVANEYGHWISPPMLALLAASFYVPRDLIDRASEVPRVYHANLARLMGVGLVVSDASIPGEEKLYEGLEVGHPLYIYRVVGTNLGQYSPTRTVLANNAKQILDQLQAPDFDGRKLAVVEQPVAATLLPAAHVTVRLMKGPAIHVSADSEGTSLLVLPFDFSYCLRARGAGVNRLVPVNLAQTGLLIHGAASVDIVYRYGLTSGTACRARDLARIKALDLENAATGRLFRDTRPPAER